MSAQRFILEELRMYLPFGQLDLKRVDSSQLDSILFQGDTVELIYPLPWQLSITTLDDASAKSWSDCMSNSLLLQERYPNKLLLLPLDVYLNQSSQFDDVSVFFQHNLHLGAMYFANCHSEIFDLLTVIESNAQLMGRDPFVRYDYPKLPLACLNELAQALAQQSVVMPPASISDNSDEKINSLAEQNSRLIDQMRYLQESLERNHYENQALRYEADKSAKIMHKAYKIIMSKSTTGLGKGELN